MSTLLNQLFPDYNPEIVVKFKPGISIPYVESTLNTLPSEIRAGWGVLSDYIPGFQLLPYFYSLQEVSLERLWQLAKETWKGQTPQLSSYFVVKCPWGVSSEFLASVVTNLPGVERAYVASGPAPPPGAPAAPALVNPDDPRSSRQGYLFDAPAGIGANRVWDQANGAGIGFVDLEQGWTLTHPDLIGAGITLMSGANQAYRPHGTSVLGVVVAVDNQQGGLGIAPRAKARVVSQWRDPSTFRTADAIVAAAQNMDRGDVLLLEAQRTFPEGSGVFAPVEFDEGVFNAIRVAIGVGVVVIEAAGNGSLDLDQHAGFGDSGAVMVGSADPANRARLGTSNFGSRVDCFGWGANIDTADPSKPSGYRQDFGETSGAAAIVAGAAVLLQSWSQNTRSQRFSPLEIRDLLRAGSNTLSQNPAHDRIGVMPNLPKIISKVQGL